MGSEVNNNIEILEWLKRLVVAPEYHPTLAEFEDPIAYIYKIEKEASLYGICKIIPPLPPPPKKTAISNLNRSLSSRSSTSTPTFTTRRQQIGFSVRKNPCPVQKPVWQSGESYTLKEFEVKAKTFEKNYLTKCCFGKKNTTLSDLEIESLYWKAGLDKPFKVEYANDMPGSAFANGEGSRGIINSHNVGETEWNMRRVSRAKGSLLRYMKEEIPGVTSPMVYIAMMFSWFAWHVEDHDLHSLNYLHMGAGKTWYGVPRDAAVAFEEVIRVNEYGGKVNPLVTFATLGEKNTLMSPEVLINAGIPCCRLVQNPGEFVVTFPRAYHSGFSHGFNCGEAANIATPEWLTVAKDAAIRRASINCPPMVSHFQLLYDVALSLCSRVPKSIRTELRSSRLKDKKKSEGEILVKDLFVKDVMQNNNLLHTLGKGSSVVILPRISYSKSICSTLKGPTQSKVKAMAFTSLCSPDLVVKTQKRLVADDPLLDKNQANKKVKGSKSSSMDHGRDGDSQCDRVSDQGLFSCVTCGILCFASVAVIQPTETASRCLMSGDCSIFTDRERTTDGLASVSTDVTSPDSHSLGCIIRTSNDLFDIPIQSADPILPLDDEKAGVLKIELHKGTSSLGLLAMAYGNCSDSEDDEGEIDISVEVYESNSRNSFPRSSTEGASSYYDPPSSLDNCAGGFTEAKFEGRNDKIFNCFRELEIDNQLAESNASCSVTEHQIRLQRVGSNCSLDAQNSKTKINDTSVPLESKSKPFAPRSNEDSSRMHIFCLQHAVRVEQQLRAIGGAHVLILCHPDYPKLEDQAKEMAEELGNDHIWNDILMRQATKEDEEIIELALDSEEALHGNGDWSVKLGINLYYSANLSRSSLYSKQMPYNSIIYYAFGRRTPANNLTKIQSNGKSSSRYKRVVAGKWCGKKWSINEVHHLLAEEESEEQDQVENIPAPIKLDLKLARPSENASTTCKSGRKRKPTRSVTEAEGSLKAEDSEEGFDVLLVSSKQQNLKNKRMKRETLDPQMKSERNDRKAEDVPGCGPTTRLRTRSANPSKDSGEKVEVTTNLKKQTESKKTKKGLAIKAPNSSKIPKIVEEAKYPCELDGCTMSFDSKQELTLHKRNICLVKGCGKKFFSHRYLVQHRRVHVDDRPLKCPWKGCKMTFKWEWARTEHIRVHTGARPYVCSESGCGLTFRFVSDFSRHRRKTSHSSKSVKRKTNKERM